MRVFRSAGSMPLLLNGPVERHAAAQAARGVELAVGVRVELRRVAGARKGAVRGGEGADALIVDRVGPVPQPEDPETRVRLHAAGQLLADRRVVARVGPVAEDLEAGAAVAAE